MKVLCDIGNTNTKILIVDSKTKLVSVKTTKVVHFLKRYKDYHLYVSCVVDRVKDILKKYCRYLEIISYKDIQPFLSIKYDTTNIGTDRLLSAFAVKRVFGTNILVVSFGTTIVLDYINSNGEYVGGEIFPGLKLLTRSLYCATSKLPFVKLKEIVESKPLLIGNNTKECIIYGILNFCSSGINNFIQKLKPRKIILTGGDAKVFKKSIRGSKVLFIENLVLLGLAIFLYDRDIFNIDELRKTLKSCQFYKGLDIKKII